MRQGLALLLVAAVPLAARADAAGRVTFLEGEASRTPRGGAAQALAEGGEVRAGDALETAAGSRLEVALADGSVIRLDERSRADLDEVKEASPKSWRVRLSLAAGALWSKVTRRLGSDAAFEVKTERFVAGVRGTEFLVEAADDHQIQVSAGAVEVGLNEGGAAWAVRRFRVEAAHALRVDRQLRTQGPLGDRSWGPHPFFAWMRQREAGGLLKHLARPKVEIKERRKAGDDRERPERPLRDRRERILDPRERRPR